MTVSSARDVTVAAPGLPTTVWFVPSLDHATVDRYVFEIFAAGARPAVDPPVSSRDLGRPAIVAGEISVNVSALITALPPGAYQATVAAMDIDGTGRSAPVPFTR